MPVLIVLDSTPCTRLNELVNAFEKADGKAYIGDDAWRYLENEAGSVMKIFLERYVQRPLVTLLNAVPDPIPSITMHMGEQGDIEFKIGRNVLRIERIGDSISGEFKKLPDDISD